MPHRLPPIDPDASAPSAAHARGNPVESVAGARFAPLGAVSRAVAAATIAAMIFGADAALRWADELPINPVSDVVLSTVDAWHHATEQIGVTTVAEASRGSVERFRRWRP